jgi:hypothetical protein
MASGTTGVWGRPYPLSTDAPNVHTDIQALANSLDTVPLFPQFKSSSASAVAGFSYQAAASVTMTLPASPVLGDTIRVAAAAGVTGATPAVVTAAGGKGINGLGLAAASTFKLGTPWAYATLQYDGTAWQIIDGQQDTGWVALTLGTNITTFTSGYAAAAKIVGNEVELSGSMKNNTGGALGTGVTIATLPSAAYESAQLVILTAALSGASPTSSSLLILASSTALETQASGIPNGFGIFLDGLRYRLS